MKASDIYDNIGQGYASKRQADPRWAIQIHQTLEGIGNLVNIGAGAGSYEPENTDVVAVEPSQTMISQRSAHAAPVVKGVAEHLPFADQKFDAAMAILTTHHWTDPDSGLAEMARVSSKQVVVTWDADFFVDQFWLVRDYVPQISERERGLATLRKVCQVLNTTNITPLLVPSDFTDGVFAAHWARPAAYLDEKRRAAMSGLALMDKQAVEAAMERLGKDIQDGTWKKRYGPLLRLPAMDLGYRLVTATGMAG